MKKLQIAISVILIAFTLVGAVPALAGDVPAPAPAASSDLLGIGYASKTGLGSTDVRITVARIINTVLQLLGIVAVVIILIGGFTWMTAGGNEEKVGEAKKWIFSGIIGLAIILAAYAIATYVVTQLAAATGYKTVDL